MFHVQFVAHNREKMLKGLNNNNSFSMESLLAENVESSNTPTPPADEEASDVLVRCLKNTRVCSNCGRMDCNNFLQCCNSNRMVMGSDGISGGGSIIKDSKPVLKFSVSAILGNEQPTSRNVIQNGKYT